MKGIILAAGQGKRLKPITSYIPKPLIPFKGKRLIDYVIDFVNHKCDEIIVITGYMGNLLEKYLKKRYNFIKIVRVDKVFQGNLFTLLQAKFLIEGGSFIIMNADHIVDKKLWKIFPDNTIKGIQLACHHKEIREILPDEMKVKTYNGVCLEKISKNLESFSGAYIGLAFIPEYLSREFFKKAEEILKNKGDKSVVEDVFSQFTKNCEARIVWVDEVSFYEVDDIKDLRRLWK